MAADTLTDTVVVARDIRKVFGDNVVIDGLDLDIRAGEFVAMLGRSGSGKSTFLRALGALDSDVSGYLRVPARRAIVFQDPRLLPWQRVLANVTIGLPSTDSGAPAGARGAGRGEPDHEGQRCGRARCPGARRSASRWPAPWCANRNCCCSTSRSAHSTR